MCVVRHVAVHVVVLCNCHVKGMEQRGQRGGSTVVVAVVAVVVRPLLAIRTQVDRYDHDTRP